MTSRERLLAAWSGTPQDHLPLTTWCFGFSAPSELAWRRNGGIVQYWYSMRLEHIHTLPFEWTLEDDFQRVAAWARWEIDDILEVSVPWSIDPRVRWIDSRRESKGGDIVMTREYTTPSGPVAHSVRKTSEAVGEGWVVQPDHVPLFEDFNIPRGVRHLVGDAGDVPKVHYLYRAPDAEARAWFAKRMVEVGSYAQRRGVAVQAWSAFGVDALVWLCGVEGAVLLAMDHPLEFRELLAAIEEADAGRIRLAASEPAVDLIVQRGWYASTDFWSPALFDEFFFEGIARNAELAHAGGKKFGYVMTTGVQALGPRLADAGVDVLYFVDPFQDRLEMDVIRESLGSHMTLVGGVNSLSLRVDDSREIEERVHRAVEELGPTNRFVLHPVDALFPDTSQEGVRRLVDAWMKYR